MTTVVEIVENQIVVVVDGETISLISAAANAAGATQVDLIEAAAAEQIADILTTVPSQGPYAYAHASALPRGITGVTSLVGGSGGTNGTFALGVSGGDFTGVVGEFTVAGGILTGVVFTNGGINLTGGTTVPTLSFSASAGLTGASATAVATPKVATQATYLAASSDGKALMLWRNDGTSTPAAVLDANSVQIGLRTQSWIDALVDTTIDTRSGYLGGYAAPDGRIMLAFRKTDGRPIFMVGGDIAARLDSAEAAYVSVDEDRSGWLVAVQSPDGRILAGIDRFSSRLWVGPRDVGGDLATLKADVAALESEVYSASSRDLILAGDSMSYVGSAFNTAAGSAMPDRLIYNVGSPGQQTLSIAIAFGVPDLLTLTPTGSVLPTSGTVSCAYSFHFLHTNNCARVEVTDEIGRAVVCWVARDGAGGYTIRPETYPASPIRLQTPARARVISLMAAGTDPSAAQALDPLYDKVLCIRAGRNDTSYDKAYDGPALVTLIQRMAALMRSGKVVVMGPTNGRGDVPTAQGGVSATLTEAQSQQNLANTIDMNGRLRAALPAAFVSPMAQFAANGGTTDRTVNGATYAVSNDTVLQVDGIHEITAGGNLTADLLETTLTAKGY